MKKYKGIKKDIDILDIVGNILALIIFVVFIVFFGGLALISSSANRNHLETNLSYEIVDYWISTRPVQTINRLNFNSQYIIRGQIISKSQDILTIGDSQRTEFYYNYYLVNILDVYSGDIEIGEILKVVQITQERFISPSLPPDYTIIKHTPLEVNSDLILFLLSNPLRNANPAHLRLYYPVITNQSAFLYTPYSLRTIERNWQFKSIDERNTLVLTEEILYSIR